jgi:hypothetical protein
MKAIISDEARCYAAVKNERKGGKGLRKSHSPSQLPESTHTDAGVRETRSTTDWRRTKPRLILAKMLSWSERIVTWRKIKRDEKK